MEGLCTNECRMDIIEYLVSNKRTTRSELAKIYSVSTNTIGRDIEYLSRRLPIYTKSGNQGGIYIMPDYQKKVRFLTVAEEHCLYKIMDIVEFDDKQIITGIIHKFSRDAVG